MCWTWEQVKSTVIYILSLLQHLSQQKLQHRASLQVLPEGTSKALFKTYANSEMYTQWEAQT